MQSAKYVELHLRAIPMWRELLSYKACTLAFQRLNFHQLLHEYQFFFPVN